MDVQLYVYDLSHGFARQMSMQFLGVQIDAVYHTSLVFGGVEYLYGRGVQTAYPGGTHHGHPMEIIPMGKTELPQDVILEYLESLKDIYTAGSYDLFAHNCNNFTNDFAMFLVGRGIPDHITTLPRRVLETPFGQMLKSQIDQSMRPITQAPLPQPSSARNGSSAARLHYNGGSVQGGTASASLSGFRQRSQAQSQLHHVSDVQTIERLLEEAKDTCAVVFLTSSTCAPCKVVEPLFGELANEYGDRATFIECDTSRAPLIAHKFAVSATPTFITFLKGQKDETWSGADAAKLRGNVRLLVEAAHPPHPHSKLQLDTFLRKGRNPTLFKKVPPLEKLVSKMGNAAKDPAVSAATSFIRIQDARQAPLPDMPKFCAFIRNCVDALPIELLFTAYDLIRLMMIDPRVCGFLAEERDLCTISKLLEKVENMDNPPYNLRLVAVHLGCNVFGSKLLSDAVVNDESCSSALVAIISNSLSDDEHGNLRVAAASLALNLATKLRDSSKSSSASSNHQLAVTASVLEALANERENPEAIKALTLCLGRLLFCTPPDAEVLELCRTLEGGSTITSKLDLVDDQDKGLLTDVIMLC